MHVPKERRGLQGQAKGTFSARYGPWALVAGASEGLGEAFARDLAQRGLNLLLVARRAAPLQALADELSRSHGIKTRILVQDLAAPDLLVALRKIAAELELGLLVYNAAFSPIGPFLERPLAEHLTALAVNCQAPLTLTHALSESMARRGRGGIVLMSSLTAFQGSAIVSSYAATKAFNLVLAEGLWQELRARGVDVLVSCAGATRTPNYLASNPVPSRLVGTTVLEPEAVARQTLSALGHQPCLVTGKANRLAQLIFSRVLPRRLAVLLMSQTTRKLYGL